MFPPFEFIAQRMREGKVILFLGPGASVDWRGQQTQGADEPWTSPQFNHLPSGVEIARYLGSRSGFEGFPSPEGESEDLARVAQFVELKSGRSEISRMLRRLYEREFAPSALYRYLARLPYNLLIVTTNYDDTLERAFAEASRPFSLVAYQTNRPVFLFYKNQSSSPNWFLPNELAIDVNRETLIYKMHGTIRSTHSESDSYVITEEDYVNFLGRIGAKTAIPAAIGEKFRKSHFLFLGYNLRYWYSRVILQMLWKDWPLKYPSWAIEPVVTPLEAAFYEANGLNIYQMMIEHFVENMERTS